MTSTTNNRDYYSTKDVDFDKDHVVFECFQKPSTPMEGKLHCRICPNHLSGNELKFRNGKYYIRNLRDHVIGNHPERFPETCAPRTRAPPTRAPPTPQAAHAPVSTEDDLIRSIEERKRKLESEIEELNNTILVIRRVRRE